MAKLKLETSVVIPTWNGEKLLKKNLPLVIKRLNKRTEIIVVEDGSRDNSLRFLEELQKKLKKTGRVLEIIKNRQNKGFIQGCRQGIKKARGELVVFLNNDVVPQKGFLTAVLPHFQDPQVFAVSFNEEQFGWAKIGWQGGFINHGVGGQGDKPHISAWASGGSAIYRKSIWNKLGGFDRLYEPFYWEDFDLGYRAWKMGYKIIWEPKAIVEHRHETTISKLDQSYVSLIKERNQLLFIWKNIDGFWRRATNIWGILRRIIGGPGYIKVVWAAWKQNKQFTPAKIRKKKLTDDEIFKLFK